MPRNNAEQPKRPEPLQDDTKEMLVAEVFGLLNRSQNVMLRHETENVDVELYKDVEDTVALSEEIDGGTRETRLSIYGSGRDSEVFMMVSITPEGGEHVPFNEADQLQRSLGMGEEPADQSTVDRALRLIRSSEEIHRSE